MHFDVALAVDKILRGIVANSEIRSLENGEVIKLNFKNKLKKLKGTPFSPKSLIKTQITTHDYNQNDVIKNIKAFFLIKTANQSTKPTLLSS